MQYELSDQLLADLDLIAENRDIPNDPVTVIKALVENELSGPDYDDEED